MFSRALTQRRTGGFTIIEILISIVIIALAFAGILAMLAGSTKLAGEVVEDTFATTLARSVYEALREGARKNAFLVNETAAGTTYPVMGFVLRHEGVVNNAGLASPPSSQWIPPKLPTSTVDIAGLNALRASDFAIFLPQGRNPAWTGGGTGEPCFVFPRPLSAVAENVGQYGAGPGPSGTVPQGSGTDDYLASAAVGGQGQPVYLDVRRVYSLKEREPPLGPGGMPITVTGGGGLSFEAADQYSFAVVIKRSVAPPIVDPVSGAFLDWKTQTPPRTTPFLPAGPANYAYVKGLYQVEVRVYRQFDPTVSGRHHEPVAGGGFIGLLALGQAQ